MHGMQYTLTGNLRLPLRYVASLHLKFSWHINNSILESLRTSHCGCH